MKKLLSTLFALFVCVSMMAGNPLKVVSGKQNLKEIMATVGTALVEYDWSTTMYDNKVSAKEKFGSDYDYVVKDCSQSFMNGFNAKSKSLKLTTDKASSKYKFVLKVDNVDSFFAAMRFVPRNEAKMWGKLTIVSTESGETLAEINIVEAEDGADFVFKDCFGKTFSILGEKVSKLK